MRFHSAGRVAAVAATATIATGVLVAPAFAQSVPDFSKLGFPNVVASATIQPGAGATLQAGGLTVDVPAGAFKDPVTFEVLEGPLSGFQMGAPSGQTPIFDFAFKVKDNMTGKLVGKFLKPVLVTYHNHLIQAGSEYWNLTSKGAYAANPKPPVISGTTLKHGNPAAAVGWVITTPASAIANTTQPVTGVPLDAWLATGAAMVAAGGALVFKRRRA